MKKSLLALAVLGAFAGVASAQSSVTIFGVADVNVRHVKTGSVKMSKVDSNGLATSRLGFKGVEDLGGGLKAGFELQHGINLDTGSQQNAAFWHRRAVVYLNGSFGEVRLGRDYHATFWNINDFEPFSTTGVGSAHNVFNDFATKYDFGRVNNAVAYFLPSGLGGLYGQVTVAAGEGTGVNKYAGGRVGYAAGPLNVAFALAKAEATTAEDFKQWNFAASYDLGMAKLMGFYNQNEFGNLEQKNFQLGVVAPLGQGELKATVQRANASGNTTAGVSTDADDATLVAVGYAYNLSKRTALYANAARIKNKGNAAFSVTGAPAAVAGLRQTSTGVEAGIKHSF